MFMHMYKNVWVIIVTYAFTVQVSEMNKPLTRLEQGVHVYYLWLYIMNIFIVQILTRKQSVLIHH